MDEADWYEVLNYFELSPKVKYVEKGKGQRAIIHFYDGRDVLIKAEEF